MSADSATLLSESWDVTPRVWTVAYGLGGGKGLSSRAVREDASLKRASRRSRVSGARP